MCRTATASIPTTAATWSSATADIVCGDDAIVVKTTRQGAGYGPSSNIRVSDCVIETQDAGVKIGTETTQDISDVRFERCDIKASSRGICIQLRDEGSVSDVEFRDIRFVSRYFSDPWWGRGEAISLTAIPRTPTAKVGAMHGIRLANVTGQAENSVRVSGSAQSRARDIALENVDVTLNRSTKYKGGLWDNRPTTAVPGIEPHGNPGYSFRHADNVTLKNCRLAWGPNRPDYFTHALEAEDVTGLEFPGFAGEAAHPERGTRPVACIPPQGAVLSRRPRRRFAVDQVPGRRRRSGLRSLRLLAERQDFSRVDVE